MLFPLTSSNWLVSTRRTYFHFEGVLTLALIPFFLCVLELCNKTVSVETMLKAQREKWSVSLGLARMFHRLHFSNSDATTVFFKLK